MFAIADGAKDDRECAAERRSLDQLKRLRTLSVRDTDLIEGEVDVLVDHTEFVPPPPAAISATPASGSPHGHGASNSSAASCSAASSLGVATPTGRR